MLVSDMHTARCGRRRRESCSKCAAELEKTSLVTWSKLGGWGRLESEGVEPAVAVWELSESGSLGSSLLSPVGEVD
jgi:hypothetical protein